MPAYAYKARDQQGKLVKGYLDALSADDAMRRVDMQGLIPLEVRVKDGAGPKAAAAKRRHVFFSHKKVPASEIVVMTRQLLTLLSAGVPILSCLDALIAQTGNAGLRGVLQGIQKDVESGSALSAAFAKYPETFSPLYIATLRAGETGGVLPEVLSRLADMMENDVETMRGVKSAMRYPIMVVVALCVAFTILITFVVPKFAALFARFDTPLPLPTRLLIEANRIIVESWFIVLPALALAMLLVKAWRGTPRGRFLWDAMILKLPVFGPLTLKVSMARFARMFSTLYQCGVPVLRVIEIVSQTVGNSVIGKEIADMAASVKQGQGLAEPLKKGKLFPPMVVQMLSVGEKSGSVDEMLGEVSKHYDMETKYMVKNLTALIEPMLIVGLGIIVLILALGIFLPMWSMIKLYRH